MKLKHGQKVLVYRAADYSQYRHIESYIHPTITINRGKIYDAMEQWKQYGEEYYLEKAKKLRSATGDTMFVDISSGFGYEITFQWQSDKEYIDGSPFYQQFYGCKIRDCGFDSEMLGVASKLAKIVRSEWSTRPLELVEGLKQLKAIRIAYCKNADDHLVVDHLDDDMFGLPIELRKPAKETTIA